MSIYTKNRGQRNILLCASSVTSISVAAMLFAAAPVQAQDAGANASDYEVIVTSRKKEESLQDVPLAITAFTEADIKERSLTQLENVALQTPGLTFEDFSNGGYGAPVIRGASQIRVDQLQQNVSIFYDGIYIPRQYAFDLGMTNVERIEVVKGPQSALYGANSFAGAINYVTQERDLSEFGGTVNGGFGTHGRLEGDVYLNVPLIEDTLAISFLGAHTEFDGDWENSHPNASDGPSLGTDETVGGWDKQTFGAGLTFETGNFSADLDYLTFESLSEDGPHYRLNNTNAAEDFNCSPLTSTLPFPPFTTSTVDRAFCGTLPSSNITNPSGVDGLLIEPRAYSETSTDMIRAELGYDLTDNISLQYLYGNVEGETISIAESTRDPLETFVFFGTDYGNIMALAPFGSFAYDTHELRSDFAFDSGISASVGAFFLNGSDENRFQSGGVDFLGSDAVTGLTNPITDSPSVVDTETRAIFASVEVPLLDERMHISVEARYSEDDIDTLQSEQSNFLGVVTIPEEVFQYSTSSFTPRVTVDYALTDQTTVYASGAKGVKSGGVNTSSVSLTDDERFYDDDENVTYEIGAKNTLLDGQLILNAAVYHIEWENLQASISPAAAGNFTSAIVDNVGSATSKGFEIDGSYFVTDNFTLNGGFSYTDATYGSDSATAGKARLCDSVATASTVCLNNADGQAILSGNSIPRVPEAQWNIGAQYDGEVKPGMDFFVRGDYTGQSDQYVSEVNLAKIEERKLLNLRAGVTVGNISGDIWMTNVMDEEYVSNSFFIVAPFGTDYIPTFGAKRRAGVTVSYDF